MTTFPDVRLVVGELVLRPFAERDVPAVVRAVTDVVTQRWLPLPWPFTEEMARQWCLHTTPALRERGDGVQLAVADVDDELVGHVGLKHTDWRAAVTELGYWMVPDHRGRGHVTAATRALAAWALAGPMERVELRAATGNLASRRVAEKAGFTCEGVLRNAGFIHDGRVDLALYSLVRGDLG